MPRFRSRYKDHQHEFDKIVLRMGKVIHKKCKFCNETSVEIVKNFTPEIGNEIDKIIKENIKENEGF